MTTRAPRSGAASAPLEREAWISLLVTVAATPLAVTKFGVLDTPLTYTYSLVDLSDAARLL